MKMRGRRMLLFAHENRWRRQAARDNHSMWHRCWERTRGDEGQNVSEYAVLLVLLVLIVVAAVHAVGMNAQQVIHRVNTALTGGSPAD